ncbi:MAG: hypothetical protein HQL20_11360 [Candidatus Omnitrophica bacterium]|nr:hypothetical protein [Candidatus Omnitrophota bacterium]
MKRIWIVLGIVLFVLAGFLVVKDQIIKLVLTSVVSRATGARVHIDGFSLNILSSTVNISGLKVFNPQGFPEGILMSCPRIDIIYDRETLFKVKRHLNLVNIELAEIGLTTNREGKLNVKSLKVAHSDSAPVPIQIDLVTLGIGKIIFKDYRHGPEPDVRVQEVNGHKSYKCIPTVRQLIALVMAEPMKAAGIKSAEIYGVVMLAGVAVLPVSVVATFIGKDSVQQTIDADFERVYEVCFDVLKRMGKITQQDVVQGTFHADINGAKVVLKLKRNGDRTELTISARKYMFPKPDIAGGVLYQISQKL